MYHTLAAVGDYGLSKIQRCLHAATRTSVRKAGRLSLYAVCYLGSRKVFVIS